MVLPLHLPALGLLTLWMLSLPLAGATATNLPPATNAPYCLLTNAHYASWSPDSRQVAYMRPNPHRIEIYDLASGTNRVLREDAITPAWSPDGQWIAYQRTPPPTRVYDSVIPMVSAEVLLISPQGGRPRFIYPGYNPHWAADSQTLFVTTSPNTQVLACDVKKPDDDAVVLLDKAATTAVRVSPNGRLIAVPMRDKIEIVSTGKQEVQFVLPIPGEATALAAWTPDSERLIVTGPPHRELGAWLVDLKKQKLFPLAAGPWSSPAWDAKGEFFSLSYYDNRQTPTLWVFPRAWIEARLQDQAKVFSLPISK